MKNKTPLELLRAAIEEQKCETPCDTLHELHGDERNICGDRNCIECKIDALRKAADLVEAELDALKARALPEGMAWPRYEGGKPVAIGDYYMTKSGDADRLCQVFFGKCDFSLYGEKSEDSWKYGERIKRPVVLAADGEPLEVGQTVWDVESGIEYEVVGIHTDEDAPVRVMRTDGSHLAKAAKLSTLTHQRPVLDADGNRIEPAMDVWWICEDDEHGIHAEKLHVESIGEDGFVACSPYNGGTWVYLEPSELYVKEPVLSSAGKPLREGETVYKVGGDGTAYVFDGMSDNVDGLAMLHHDGKPYIGTGIRVDQLIHEQPESWERLEEDAKKGSCDYFGCDANGCHGCPAYDWNTARGGSGCENARRADLMRRAKKLAGVAE